MASPKYRSFCNAVRAIKVNDLDELAKGIDDLNLDMKREAMEWALMMGRTEMCQLLQDKVNFFIFELRHLRAAIEQDNLPLFKFITDQLPMCRYHPKGIIRDLVCQQVSMRESFVEHIVTWVDRSSFLKDLGELFGLAAGYGNVPFIKLFWKTRYCSASLIDVAFCHLSRNNRLKIVQDISLMSILVKRAAKRGDVRMLKSLDYWGTMDMWRKLVEQDDGQTLVCAPDARTTQFLLSRGYDPNRVASSRDLLLRAVSKNSLEIVKILLSYGADPNRSTRKGNTALHFVRCEDICEELLSHGADVAIKNNKGRNALHQAIIVHYKWTTIVQKLLCHQSNIESRAGFLHGKPLRKKIIGQTALHLAVRSNHNHLVELLLDRDANLEARDSKGQTPLHYAANDSMVNLLISRGAVVDSRDNLGLTPLISAAQAEGRISAIFKLVAAGADLNATDSRGYSALHLAVRHEDHDLIKFIGEHDFDMNSRALDGTLAFQLAKDIGTRNLLFSLGADYNLGHMGKDFDWKLDDQRSSLFPPFLGRSFVESAGYHTSARILWPDTATHEASHERRQIRDMCNREIHELRALRLSGCFTYLDLLVRPRALIKLIHSVSPRLEEKFLIFGKILETNRKRELNRQRLIERAEQSVALIFRKFPALPAELISHILAYFTDMDLQKLIEKVPPAT